MAWDNGSGWMEAEHFPLFPEEGERFIDSQGEEYIFESGRWVSYQNQNDRPCQCNSGQSWVNCSENSQHCG